MSRERIAHCRAEIAALEADGIDHYDLDGRLARLTGADLYGDNPSWETRIPYAEQCPAAQHFYNGWVAENLSLRLSEDIKHAKAA